MTTQLQQSIDGVREKAEALQPEIDELFRLFDEAGRERLALVPGGPGNVPDDWMNDEANAYWDPVRDLLVPPLRDRGII